MDRYHKLDADAVRLFQSVQLRLEEGYDPAAAAQIRHILSAAVKNCAISDHDIAELQSLLMHARPKQRDSAGKSGEEDDPWDSRDEELLAQQKRFRDRLRELEKNGERMFRQMTLSDPERRKLKSFLRRLQGNCQERARSRFKCIKFQKADPKNLPIKGGGYQTITNGGFKAGAVKNVSANKANYVSKARSMGARMPCRRAWPSEKRSRPH